VKGTENKQPKIVAVCITTITECLKYGVHSRCRFFLICRTYGIKVFPTKIILKVFAKWFDHSAPAVRDAAQNFAVELCRWLGVDFVQKPYLENLRESQVIHDIY
jgi:hypothetical protein